jgi:WD40 repeat protein
LKETKHSVTCAQYNSTADKLLSTYNDEDIYTFNAKTGAVEHSYSGHRNNATVKGCSWFGDDFIVSGSDDGYVYGWDTETQHIVMSLYADENGVVSSVQTVLTYFTSALYLSLQDMVFHNKALIRHSAHE